MCKKKNRIVEIHKYTVIEPLEEIYPETKQKIVRPCLNIKRVALKLLLYILLLGILGYIINYVINVSFPVDYFLINSKMQLVLIYLLLSSTCILLNAKRIVVFIIRLYQRFGPYEIRCRCLFIPNCSEYMILAIEKYGLYKGIKKGIDRFRRCHEPNGGIDYP